MRMATIPHEELRNNVDEVLRRVEAGERFTITVSGSLWPNYGPMRTRQWVRTPSWLTCGGHTQTSRSTKSFGCPAGS